EGSKGERASASDPHPISVSGGGVFRIFEMTSKVGKMKLQPVALVLAGIVIGCAVGATVPKTSASSSGDSEWRCFKVSLLPDVERAEGLAEGAGYASVLNQL